jgi:hypothetical protein
VVEPANGIFTALAEAQGAAYCGDFPAADVAPMI